VLEATGSMLLLQINLIRNEQPKKFGIYEFQINESDKTMTYVGTIQIFTISNLKFQTISGTCGGRFEGHNRTSRYQNTDEYLIKSKFRYT